MAVAIAMPVSQREQLCFAIRIVRARLGSQFAEGIAFPRCCAAHLVFVQVLDDLPDIAIPALHSGAQPDDHHQQGSCA